MNATLTKPTAEKAAVLLDPHRIKPFFDQPRKRFRGIPQLAESIRLVGQVTPIVVTRCDEPQYDAELVDGERRLQACMFGKMKIRVIFGECRSADHRFALSLAANFCRQEHDCIEIAEAIQRLIQGGRKIDEIRGIFGKSTAWVYQYLSLLRLHPTVREMLKLPGDGQSAKPKRSHGVMTMQLGLLLVGLDESLQVHAANRIVKTNLSVAAARNMIRTLAKVAGVKVGTSLSPRNRFTRMWNAVDTFRNAIEPLTEMSHDALSAVALAVGDRDRQTLADQLDDLGRNVQALSCTIRKASEK